MIYRTIANTRVPALGFGTLWITGDDCRRAVHSALEIGYRHIDTAQAYENEAEVGAALAGSGVARSEIFLTTKIHMEANRYNDAKRRVAQSLEDLRTEYVDLLLIHWPSTDVPLAETMRALNELQAAGACRHIGVSNFTLALITQARELAVTPLVTNQIEYHALLGQELLLEEARRHGSMVTAYSPLARGKIAAEPVLSEIGKRHGKNASQVGLRWLVQQDAVVAIPRTSSADHARSNFEIFDFALDGAEMARIDALPKDQRVVQPKWAPVWDQPVAR